MKPDNICQYDKYGYCPDTCDQYEERDVCLELLKHKLANDYLRR